MWISIRWASLTSEENRSLIGVGRLQARRHSLPRGSSNEPKLSWNCGFTWPICANISINPFSKNNSPKQNYTGAFLPLLMLRLRESILAAAQKSSAVRNNTFTSESYSCVGRWHFYASTWQTQWGTAQVSSIGPWRKTKVSANANASRGANRIILGTNN